MAYLFIDLAEDILKSAELPMSVQQIWEKAKTTSLVAKLNSKGKTPWASLGARLYVDVRDNPETKFILVGKNPARFFLKSRKSELSEEKLLSLEIVENKVKPTSTKYTERDLHALLTYFVYTNPGFSRNRSIFTKTIFHEVSKKKGFNEWLHPDLVGVYLPIDDWKQDVIEFNRLLDNNSIKIFSFEMKKSLNKGNYRESINRVRLDRNLYLSRVSYWQS